MYVLHVSQKGKKKTGMVINIIKVKRDGNGLFQFVIRLLQ